MLATPVKVLAQWVGPLIAFNLLGQRGLFACPLGVLA